MEIFEQYFYDINQWTRQHGNDSEYSDMLTNLQEKIDDFNTVISPNVTGVKGVIYIEQEIPNLYKIGRIDVDYASEPGSSMGLGKIAAEYHTYHENIEYGNSPLTTWTKKRPIYNRFVNQSGDKILKIRPYPQDGVDTIQIFYTRKPNNPNWNYMVINDKALYNSTNSQDFELHPSEESELVYRILAYAGIAIEKPQLTQMAAGLEQAKVQQEKQ